MNFISEIIPNIVNKIDDIKKINKLALLALDVIYNFKIIIDEQIDLDLSNISFIKKIKYNKIVYEEFNKEIHIIKERFIRYKIKLNLRYNKDIKFIEELKLNFSVNNLLLYNSSIKLKCEFLEALSLYTINLIIDYISIIDSYIIVISKLKKNCKFNNNITKETFRNCNKLENMKNILALYIKEIYNLL